MYEEGAVLRYMKKDARRPASDTCGKATLMTVTYLGFENLNVTDHPKLDVCTGHAEVYQ